MAKRIKLDDVIKTHTELEDMECELSSMNKWLNDTYKSALRVSCLQKSVNETLPLIHHVMKGIDNED